MNFLKRSSLSVLLFLLYSVNLSGQMPQATLVETHDWPHTDFIPITKVEDSQGRSYLVGELIDPATRHRLNQKGQPVFSRIDENGAIDKDFMEFELPSNVMSFYNTYLLSNDHWFYPVDLQKEDGSGSTLTVLEFELDGTLIAEHAILDHWKFLDRKQKQYKNIRTDYVQIIPIISCDSTKIGFYENHQGKGSKDITEFQVAVFDLSDQLLWKQEINFPESLRRYFRPEMYQVDQAGAFHIFGEAGHVFGQVDLFFLKIGPENILYQPITPSTMERVPSNYRIKEVVLSAADYWRPDNQFTILEHHRVIKGENYYRITQIDANTNRTIDTVRTVFEVDPFTLKEPWITETKKKYGSVRNHANLQVFNHPDGTISAVRQTWLKTTDMIGGAALYLTLNFEVTRLDKNGNTLWTKELPYYNKTNSFYLDYIPPLFVPYGNGLAIFHNVTREGRNYAEIGQSNVDLMKSTKTNLPYPAVWFINETGDAKLSRIEGLKGSPIDFTRTVHLSETSFLFIHTHTEMIDGLKRDAWSKVELR